MRGSRIVVVVAAFALLTSGCWLEAGQSAGRAGFNPFEVQITAANVSQLGVAWQHQLTGPVRESLISPGSTPAVYVPSEGALTAYFLANGQMLGTTRGVPMNVDPVLAGGPYAGFVVVTDQHDAGGCQYTIFDGSINDSASAQGYGQSIGVPSNGCFSATPLATDTIVVPWTQVSLSGHSPTCPSDNTEAVYEGLTSIGRFEFGSLATTVCYTGAPPTPPLHMGTPSQVGNLIVLPAGDTLDNVVALNSSTGNQVWSAFGGGGAVNGPAIALPNGDVAYTTSTGDLRVHNATTGAFKWSAHLDASLTLPPAANSTSIFVATPSGALDALPVGGCNAATCSPVWHATLASPASVRPSIGGNVVYVGSTDGTVTAFPANGCNATTCTSLWTGTTGSKITGAPAIGQGHVVVGSDNGTVTAFALPPHP